MAASGTQRIAATKRRAVTARTRKSPSKRQDPVAHLREICLALPEATEKEAWQTPTFRVRDKLFAMYDDHHGVGEGAVWCKAPPGAQEILVGAHPKRFFKPPYVGHKGWIGMRLDGNVDWEEVAVHVEESYRMTAPTRLLALLDKR